MSIANNSMHVHVDDTRIEWLTVIILTALMCCSFSERCVIPALTCPNSLPALSALESLSVHLYTLAAY